MSINHLNPARLGHIINAGDGGDMGRIPGLGRIPGEGHGNPLQYSYLENPMDRGAWWATVHSITKSWTGLTQLSSHTSTTKQYNPNTQFRKNSH